MSRRQYTAQYDAVRLLHKMNSILALESEGIDPLLYMQ